MIALRFTAALIASLATVSIAAQATPGSSVPMCAASQLSLATDAENGTFDGMSHSGTLLVLRNLGTSACRLEAFPAITFSDAKGPLKIAFTTPEAKFMHPGPVMLPAIIAARAEATSSLRWVSSPVYDPGVCFKPTSVAVRIGADKVQTDISNSICGANVSTVSVERTRFNPDPVYSPANQK